MLLLLLPVLGLLQPAVAGLVGAPKCTWGPSYWCANIPQASSCRAVSHCINAVWKKENVPADTDEICDICKDMVGQARDTLMSNETQEELKEVFDGSCDLIPIKLVAKECRTLFDQFVPELVETLASEMNPDTVCTVAGLCNSARIDAMLVELYGQQVGGLDCGVCRSQVQEVAIMLNQTPDNQVELKLLELCGYLGSFSDACMYTVSTELQEILGLLRSELKPELCDVKGVCTANSAVQLAVSPALTDDLQCEFCEKVVKHWIDVYASNASLQEFKEILDGICEKLDSKNSDHCKHIVDDYYIPMFEFVRSVDPKMVCSLAGLCGTQGFLELDGRVPITSLFTPAESTDLVPLVSAQQNTKSGEKPTCVICEYVLHELQTYLKNGQTEAEIKQYVDAICDKMPSVVRGECRKFVDTYEPLIVQLLVDEIDPSQICVEIKLCDGNQITEGVRELEKSTNCETCEFVMTEVFSILSDKDDQEMVKNVLESICYRLPATIDQPCEDFVERYTPMILSLISQSLSPDEVCAALDLCSTEAVTPKPDQTPPKKLGDTGCILCEYVISNLDKILEDKNNEAEIKRALDTVCSYLPSTVTKECTQFVDTYTAMIIDLLTNEITPEQICTNLGLCKPKKTSFSVSPPSDIDVKGPYCTLCEYAMTTVDQMLKDNKNEAEIEQALDVVCYHLTAPVHKECLKMVNKYTKDIINLLVNDYSPQMVCSELSLCVSYDIRSNVIADGNDISVSVNQPPAQDGVNEKIGCVMCEFAMQVLDEHLDDGATIDQVERAVQFLCSYLPGSIADQCEAFVDKNGQRIIDALVKDELNPQEVCTLELNLCDGLVNNIRGSCEFGPELWCATPFHAKLCNAVQFCQVTVWNQMKTYSDNF